MRSFLSFAMILVWLAKPAVSQDFPLSFNGLLTQGDIVSYQSLDQGYRLSIASKEAYEMHVRGASESDDVMIETEPVVAAAAKAALDLRKPPREGYRYQNDKVSFRWATSFRKVLFVGNDYVILSKVDSSQPYQALKFEKISSIGWLRKEPSTYTNRSLQKIAMNGAEASSIDDKLVKYVKKIIERYDDNKDGYLVSSEWEAMLMSPVPADADEDGKVTADEYAQMLSKRSKRSEQE